MQEEAVKLRAVEEEKVGACLPAPTARPRQTGGMARRPP